MNIFIINTIKFAFLKDVCLICIMLNSTVLCFICIKK